VLNPFLTVVAQDKAIKKRLRVGCVVLAMLLPTHARAQFTGAHSYDNTPAGTNQLELSYAYAHADASLDASLVITGASIDVNQGSIGYTRYFSLFRHVAWAEAELPVAGLAGSINGTHISGTTAGAGDSGFAMTMLFKGGPALGVAQFADYMPTTTLGASIAVTAPTGAYSADRILNPGADRWSFKPELALSHPFGPEQKWQIDAYANVYVFTDNTTYHGREILRQQPLPGLEGDISYSVTDSLRASFDTRYSGRGTTFVDGVDQDNAQRNLVLGGEVNVSLTSRHSLLVEVAKALVHQNGPAVTGVSVKYDYVWGKGY
jgi:hypothetical protein